MQISGLSAQYQAQLGSLSALASINALAPTTDSADTADALVSALSSSDASAAAKTDISGPGQLYSKLEKLQAQDPDKFKQVVTDIANKLQQLASSDSGNPGDRRLAGLAAKFQQVAQTGDLSALKPPSTDGNGMKAAYAQAANAGDATQAMQQTGHAHHGHHGHHGQAPQGQSGQQDGSTDIRSQLQSIFSEVDTALS